MQKSLQGLDNTAAEGNEAIDNILEVVKTLGDHGSEATWLKSLEQTIKVAKRYLKTEFKSHVGREETCGDHCSTHALKDRSDINLQGTCHLEHIVSCEKCESLETVFKETEHEINRVEMSGAKMAVKPRIQTICSIHPGMEGTFASHGKPRRREAMCSFTA